MFHVSTATMKTVRFINDNHLPYKTNQVVQFSDAEADAIILQGSAALYTPGVYTPYVPPAAGQSPVTNIGLGGGSGNPVLDADVQALKNRINSMDANANGIADTTDKDENAPNYVQLFTTGLLP